MLRGAILRHVDKACTYTRPKLQLGVRARNATATRRAPHARTYLLTATSRPRRPAARAARPWRSRSCGLGSSSRAGRSPPVLRSAPPATADEEGVGTWCKDGVGCNETQGLAAVHPRRLRHPRAAPCAADSTSTACWPARRLRGPRTRTCPRPYATHAQLRARPPHPRAHRVDVRVRLRHCRGQFFVALEQPRL